VSTIASGVELRDMRIEAWLDRHGVTWDFHADLPLAKIDRAASKTNQARLEALNEETLDRYQADMERGDRFPPIVVRRRARSMVVIGGNHRVMSATRAKLNSLAAYVVDCDEETGRVLTYEDNRYHGLPPTEKERLLQAIHLVRTQDMSQPAAAALVGVSKSRLERALAVAETDARAKRLNVGGWLAITETTRWRLGSIGADGLFVEAAEIAADCDLSVTAAYNLVTRVNQAGDFSAARKILVAERANAEAALAARVKATGKRGYRTPRIRALDGLSELISLEPSRVALACEDPDQAAYLEARCVDAAKHLRTMLGHLRRRREQA
jgi:hypothetical protein